MLKRWSVRTCEECGRVFDLTDEWDVNEWSYGHDCGEVAAVEPSPTARHACPLGPRCTVNHTGSVAL